MIWNEEEAALDRLTEQFVGTMFAIRISRDNGEVVLQRNRRPQPPQGGDVEIEYSEIRRLFGPGAYLVEMIDATPPTQDDIFETLYAQAQREFVQPPHGPRIYGRAFVRVR